MVSHLSPDGDNTVLSVVCFKEMKLDFWIRFIIGNTLSAQLQNPGLHMVKKKTSKSLPTGKNNQNYLDGEENLAN